MKAHLLLVGTFAATMILMVPSPVMAESERQMMLEVHMGSYQPGIDSQFEDGTPYADAFGTDSATLIGAHLDYQVFQAFGSLAIVEN